MAQTALSPTRVEAIGSFTKTFVGVAGGSGTSTTVSLPGNVTVRAVVVGGATSATAPYVDTVSANTFTATHANGDLFAYLAYATGGV